MFTPLHVLFPSLLILQDQGAANEGVKGSEQPGAPAPAAAAALAAAVAAAAGGGGDAAATSATPESAAIEQATAAGEEGSVPEPEGGPGAAPAKPTEDVKPVSALLWRACL